MKASRVKTKQASADAALHNPDINPAWTPLMRRRVYACRNCGAEKTMTTNHTGMVWSDRCSGKCRSIIAPHTACESVHPFYGPHIYLRDAGEE